MCNSNSMFFASTNSGEGFNSRFDEIFAGTDRHYIIKGGPGTGKSSLMKYVTNTAESKGYSVERFCCASDPDSLDGIIINDLNIGISDGTAPHTMDPVYPGTHSDIINLGAFWDGNQLKKQRTDIISYITKKNKLYDILYRYLNSALIIHRLNKQAISTAINTNKISDSIHRLLKDHKIESGNESIRLTDGITMNGFVQLKPYINSTQTVYTLSDKYGISETYFNLLRNELKDKKIILSYDALDPTEINMIYIPSCSILFCKHETENCRMIHAERFISKSEMLITPKAIKHNQSQIADLLECGIKLFKEIKDIHFSLEEIYINAMDFSAKEEYQQRLVNEIFS